MTAATIRASAAYRKRQVAKMKRYEAALQEIAFGKWQDGWQLDSKPPHFIARAALQEPSDAGEVK